jgi:hypothetical protein
MVNRVVRVALALTVLLVGVSLELKQVLVELEVLEVEGHLH